MTWRWCFYINLPIGAVTFFFVLFFLPANKAYKQRTSWKQLLAELDIAGTIVFLPSIICLLLALQWGGSKYPWSNGRVIALFVVFGVLMIAFLVLQWYGQERATVPPRMIKNRNVWGSAWYAAALGGGYFVLTYYVSFARS